MLANVKYELQEFERLMASEFAALRAETDQERILTLETERIRMSLVRDAFLIEDEQHLKRYIQYHQQALVDLLDKTALTALPKRDSILRKHVIKNLEELLGFVEHHFNKYLDWDVKVPDGYVANVKNSFQEQSKVLFRQLTEQQADPRLIELFFRIIAKVVDSGTDHTVTYRKVRYGKEILLGLSGIVARPPGGDINEELRALMYFLNCNSNKAFAYHANYIGAKLQEVERCEEKLAWLSFLQKKINQAQTKPGLSYNPRAASIRTQVGNYISEELNYLEHQQRLNGLVRENRSESAMNGFKIKVEMSVSQLSYFIKIFLETAFLNNKNVTELLKFMSQWIVTKRTEVVSYDSLRAKFYNVEDGTKSAVRHILLTMVNHIDKDER